MTINQLLTLCILSVGTIHANGGAEPPQREDSPIMPELERLTSVGVRELSRMVRNDACFCLLQRDDGSYLFLSQSLPGRNISSEEKSLAFHEMFGRHMQELLYLRRGNDEY